MRRLFVSAAREQAEQQALFFRLSARIERQLAPTLIKTYREAADALENFGEAAYIVPVMNNSGALERTLRAGVEVTARVFAKRLRAQLSAAYPKHYRHMADCPLHQRYPNVLKASSIEEEARRQQQEALDNRLLFAPSFETDLAAFTSREVATRITQINTTTRDQIRAIVQAGMEQGDTIEDIAKRIRQTSSAIGRTRAHIIARTESHTAGQAGLQFEAEGNEFDMRKSWSATKDERTRREPEDEFDHTKVDTTPIPMDAWFNVSGEALRFPGAPGGSAGNIINCFPAGTLVQGRFSAATRFLYRGDIIEIKTASGRALAVTPNHPILTRFGLIAANKIKEGHDLITYGGENKDAFGVGDDDHENMPTPIEQVFSALMNIGEAARVRVGGVHFHGDAGFAQSDIDIVRAYRELIFGNDTKLFQALDYLAFIKADSEMPSIFSALGSFFQRMFAPAHSGIGGGSQASAFNGGDSGHSSEHACTAVSLLETQKLKIAGDTPPADLKILGQFFNGIPGFVQFDQVVEINVVPFSGHVYDLQEASGLLLSNGIVTSNCRCAALHHVV